MTFTGDAYLKEAKGKLTASKGDPVSQGMDEAAVVGCKSASERSASATASLGEKARQVQVMGFYMEGYLINMRENLLRLNG